MATVLTRDEERQRITQRVVAAQGGDRDAFGELFEDFEQQVLAIGLRRLGDFCEAQELCQDVFVQALQKLHQLRTPEAFGGWLCAIAQRMAINRVTRRGPDVTADPSTLDTVRGDEPTPLCALLAGERRARVQGGLARLRVLDRRTLEAFYVEGRTLQQMCGDFQAPLGTIKRRLHVARKRLAREVDSRTAV
jgi:RNA polymerase sigma-70 factor (ECF subfamily)